jgi:hypothetical protein
MCLVVLAAASHNYLPATYGLGDHHLTYLNSSGFSFIVCHLLWMSGPLMLGNNLGAGTINNVGAAGADKASPAVEDTHQ